MVRKKKKDNSGLVPASELTPLTFPLCRKAAISVAFMWRNSPISLLMLCVCVFPGGDVLPWSLCVARCSRPGRGDTFWGYGRLRW